MDAQVGARKSGGCAHDGLAAGPRPTRAATGAQAVSRCCAAATVSPVLVRALTSTLVLLMTLTTSPTYDPGSCSCCSSSRSMRTERPGEAGSGSQDVAAHVKAGRPARGDRALTTWATPRAPAPGSCAVWQRHPRAASLPRLPSPVPGRAFCVQLVALGFQASQVLCLVPHSQLRLLDLGLEVRLQALLCAANSQSQPPGAERALKEWGQTGHAPCRRPPAQQGPAPWAHVRLSPHTQSSCWGVSPRESPWMAGCARAWRRWAHSH